MADGKIDASSVVEQLIAGAILIGVGAAVAHIYDVREEKRHLRSALRSKGKRR